MRLFRRRRRVAAQDPYVPRHSGWAQAAVPPPPDPAVRLGFADGTELELAATHPSAVALKTVADVIARDLT